MRSFNPKLIPPPKSDCPGWPELTAGRPIDLEIGAGAGFHAISYAKQNKQRHLIAIERTEKYLRMKGRHERHESIQNLSTIRADAVNWLVHFSLPDVFERIFLLYPNPYPKSRHANLRWYNMPFMGFLISRLKPDGELVLATNKAYYHREAITALKDQWGMHLIADEQISSGALPRTHFEKKYLERGETCWNLIFKRPNAPI